MKKDLLLFFALIIAALSAHAQTDSERMNKLIAELTPLDSAYKAQYENKDYSAAIQSINQMLKIWNGMELSKEENEKYGAAIKNSVAILYYNQACSYSLANKRKEAIDAFRQSVAYGYTNYRSAKNDEDFKNIQNDKKFKKILESIHQYDKLFILQHSKGYNKENTDSLPHFRYQSPENYPLEYTRNFFNLDSVAGNGDEISKFKNILKFVHDTIPHDGGNFGFCESDPIDIYNYHKTTGKGVNCRQLAITLCGMYLAMGYPARYVTCLPQDANDSDCHVICCVYSQKLDKWLWMDPTFNAYVEDDKGNLLSIEEVRSRLIANQPLVLNEDANWNNKKTYTKEYYLDYYMAKNLYWMECTDFNCFNPEPRFRDIKRTYIGLVPQGFTSKATEDTMLTSDPDYFWQKPTTSKN